MGKMTRMLHSALDKARTNGVVSRASICVVTDTSVRAFVNCGELDRTPIGCSTMFDVASITKTVPVSTLALLALDSGKIRLDTPLVELIPSLSLKCEKIPQFVHLLTQTLDFGFSLASMKRHSPNEILGSILTATLRSEPGETFSYCNATSIILGLAIEKIYGSALDVVAQQYIFGPLSMRNTQFRLSESQRSLVVPTEICDWRGRAIQGEIHDESAWVLDRIIVPGAAGLFSTTDDLGRYVSMLLKDDGSFFSKGFVDLCSQNQIVTSCGAETALGFEYNQPYMGTHRSPRTIGKTGFTGSVIVADIERKIGLTMLTDYTWPKRKINKDAIMSLRQECSDIVWNYA